MKLCEHCGINEVKEKDRQARIIQWQNPEYRENMSKKIRDWSIRYYNDPLLDDSIRRFKISTTMKTGFLNGRLTPNKARFYYAFGVRFRSSWELNFAIWLTNKGIIWEYEKYRFKLSNGTIYIIDFYLPQFDIFVEVKGNYKGKFDLSKSLLFVKEYPNKKLYLLDSEGHKKIKKINKSYIVGATEGLKK